MATFRAPRASTNSCAIVAAIALLCPAGPASGGVGYLGSVNPTPVDGVVSSAQFVVGGDASANPDIRAWVQINFGSTLQYGSMIVGNEEEYFGQINVLGDFLNGLNTRLTLTSSQGSSSNPTVQIGREGTGRLLVSGGATMNLTGTSGNFTLGVQSTGNGYATITDPFTILTLIEDITVGQNGMGYLEILNGALVQTTSNSTSRNVRIGNNATAIGTMVVDGVDSLLRPGGNLVVGNLGQGTLVISNQAIVDANNTSNAVVTVGPLGRIEMSGGTLIGNYAPVASPVTGFGTVVNGFLGGSGLVRGSVFFSDDSSMEVNSADVLLFDGDVDNQGAMTIDGGEVRFLAGLSNNAPAGPVPPGRISLENGGTARFMEPLVNDGVISNAHGTTNLHGEITNNGTIFVARDTVTTFYDEVITPGTVTVLPGGNALFLTNLSFVGLSVLQLGVGTTDLTDTSAQIIAGGAVALDGTLEINFDGGFTPSVGQSFKLITAAGGITGAFDSILMPLLPQDLEVGLIYSPTSVKMELTIVDTNVDGVPGDYNDDGTVNAADYTIWRDHAGQFFPLQNGKQNSDTPGFVDDEDYAFWKANFGNRAPFGAGGLSTAETAAPEPSGMLLVLTGLTAFALARRSLH